MTRRSAVISDEEMFEQALNEGLIRVACSGDYRHQPSVKRLISQDIYIDPATGKVTWSGHTLFEGTQA